MARIILAIVSGFIVWTILWLGSNALLTAIAPNLAFAEGTEITTGALLIGLFRSFAASIVSGLTAVLISKEFSKTTLCLGILLLLTGIFFQYSAWNLMPLWYHIPFLLLLIPMTIWGGKLRKA